MPLSPQEIVEGFDRRDRRLLSRALTLAESEAPGFADLYDSLHGRVGRGARLGITGPPGAGKSTLISELIREYRGQDREVAVVAVDPSSPFTGGALLGDRVRMQDHILDPKVFIRSMATRGTLGGLSRTTHEVADLVDAFGFDRILLETVGVGQSEHDILSEADLVLVVLHPGAGDSVQTLKAGLTELADLFVLNKADQDGADRLERDLHEMLELRFRDHGEEVPILRTVATRGEGVRELVDEIEDQLRELSSEGELARRRQSRREAQVRRILEQQLHSQLFGSNDEGGRIGAAQLSDTSLPPYTQARRLLEGLWSEKEISE